MVVQSVRESAGIDMRLVDDGGRLVPSFPDLPGPAMEELMLHRDGPGTEDLVAQLIALGMGAFPSVEVPPLPADFDVINDVLTNEVVVALRAAGDAEGIALHKLTRPALDIWDCGLWVTREECRAAQRAWQRAGSPAVGGRNDVGEFLALAAAHGGFRVWAAD